MSVACDFSPDLVHDLDGKCKFPAVRAAFIEAIRREIRANEEDGRGARRDREADSPLRRAGCEAGPGRPGLTG